MAVNWDDFTPVGGSQAISSDDVDWSQFTPTKPKTALERAREVLSSPDGGVMVAAGSLIDSAMPKGGKDQGWLANTVVDVARAPITFSQTLAGIGNLATAGGLGKLLDVIGYDPKAAQSMLSDHYGDSSKQAQQSVNLAGQQMEKGVSDARGFTDTAGAVITGTGNLVSEMIKNPGYIQEQVIQTLPDMLFGAGIVGKFGKVAFLDAASAAEVEGAKITGERAVELLAGAAPKTAVEVNAIKAGQAAVELAQNKLSWLGHGIEGAQAAGQNAWNIREDDKDNLSGQYLQVPAGVITGLLGRGASKIPGFGDVQTAAQLAIAGPKNGGAGMFAKMGDGIAMRTLKGGISEGIFQELPQSAQEQIWQNLAQGKPWSEGVLTQGVQGAVTGFAMGMGEGGISSRPQAPPAPSAAPENDNVITPSDAGPTLGLPHYAGSPLVVFPDGSTMTQAEAEQRRLDSMVQKGAPSTASAESGLAYTSPSVQMDKITSTPNPDSAIRTSALALEDEFNSLLKNEQIDLAYRRDDAKKESDFDRAIQQADKNTERPAYLAPPEISNLTPLQADALTRVQGFDDPAPTAIQIAMEAARRRTSTPELSPITPQQMPVDVGGASSGVMNIHTEAHQAESAPAQATPHDIPSDIPLTPQAFTLSTSRRGSPIITGNADEIKAAEPAIRNALPGIQIIPKTDNDGGYSLVVGKSADLSQVQGVLDQLNQEPVNRDDNSARQDAEVAPQGAETRGDELRGGGPVQQGSMPGGAVPGADVAQVPQLSGEPAVPLRDAGQPAVDAPPIQESPPAFADSPAYTKTQATLYAKRMSNQGLPSVVIPHPTEAGKFAIVPADWVNETPQAESVTAIPVAPSVDGVQVGESEQGTANGPPKKSVGAAQKRDTTQQAATVAGGILDATPREAAVVGRAEPMLDLNNRQTGGMKVDYPNGDGVTLISADGEKAINFPSLDTKSGTESLRAQANAQAFAIDNPYSIDAPHGDLVIQPVFGKQGQQSETTQAALPVAGDTQAEQKIRAAFRALPSVSLGKAYPITVEHNGVTRQLMARQDTIGKGNNKSAIHLTEIHRGRMIASDEPGWIVQGYKLDGKDRLTVEGMPRKLRDDEAKKFQNNFSIDTQGKEPWQMTREEYFTDTDRVRSDVMGGKGTGYVVKYDYIAPSGAGPFKGTTTTSEKHAKGDTIKAIFGDAIVSSVSKAKPESINSGEMFDDAKAFHRASVEKAIAAGKLIPKEVLADYPDLAPSQVKETPTTLTSEPAKETFGKVGGMSANSAPRQNGNTNDPAGATSVVDGNGILVNSAGTPLVVYHGTGSDEPITKFRPGKDGIWFAEDSRVSYQFGEADSYYLRSPNHLDMINPSNEELINGIEKRLFDDGELINEDGKPEPLFELVKWGNLTFNGRNVQSKVIAEVKRLGYTGLKWADFHQDAVDVVHVVFDPDQVLQNNELSPRTDRAESSQTPEQPSPADEVVKAKEILDAANVTGTDRTTTIAAVRRGDLTAEDVAESHPVPQNQKSSDGATTSLAERGLDGGEADHFFSRSGSLQSGPSGSISKDALDSVILRVTESAPGNFSRDTVVAIPTFSALPEPVIAKAQAEGYDENGRHEDGYKIPGVAYDGKVYLVQDNISSELEAEETLLHERLHQILHGNPEDENGQALRASLGRLYSRMLGKDGIVKMAKDAGIDISGPLNALPTVKVANRPAFLVEEFLAHAEGSRAYESMPGRIFRAIREFWGEFRDWLRASGFAKLAEAVGVRLGDFTQSDLAWTLKGIREQAAGTGSKAIRFMSANDEGRPQGDSGEELDPRFSRSSQTPPSGGVSTSGRIIGDSQRQYTPEQQAAFANTGRVVHDLTIKERISALWQDAGKKMAQGIVDQFAPVKEISSHAYTLLRLAKGATGAFEALLHHGKLSIRDGAFDADVSGGVMERVFYKLGKESTDFLYWVAGNRAERLMREGKERLFSEEDIAAYKSLSNGVTDFDYTLPDGSVTRDRTKIYADALKEFNAFNKNVLDMAEQSGLIDPESRKLWEHEFYVPFYRVVDEQDGGVRGMNIRQGMVRQEAFKKLKGGTEGLNDLLENTLMNWAHLIDASAKNRAAIATLEAAEKLGAARKADPGEKQTVWIKKDGNKVEYKVDDPYLLTAIQGLEFSGLRGSAMTALSTAKHWLTVGVTASPFFKVRNLIRDSVQAIGTSDLGYNPITNVKEGWKLTDRDSQEYVSALAGGGLIRFGTMLEGSEVKRVRQLIKNGAKDAHILDNESKVRAFYDNTLEPLLMAYNELGNRGEEINRMALYDQLIKQGKSHAEASLLARDLMDFSMRGAWTSVRFLTQVVPFMNARLQGMYKLGRAAKDDPAKFATVLGAVSMISLALLAAYHDDDDWKKREDWDRDNYWWFKFGGTAFRIPKPFEIGAMATLTERTAEAIFDKEMTGKRFRERVTKLLSDQLSMNPTPQLVKPIIDLYANKDSFSGRPIETMGMERLDSEYRFRADTSMVARGISTATGGAASPVQIDQLIRGYFSWLGTFSVAIADIAVRAASNEPTQPTLDYLRVATGGMAAGLDGAHSRYVTQMYEQAKELEQAYGTYHHLIKEGKPDEAKEYRADHQEDLRHYRSTEAVKRKEAKLNERIRMIERSAMDADAKREKINQIRSQQDKIARPLFN